MRKTTILLFAFVLMLTSCTEDKFITPENPYVEKITSFTVKNSAEKIEAVISETDKEIVLVLPYYLGLVALELDIKTEEGYTIIDQPENTLIEDVREYLLNKKEPLTYRVKDTEDKTTTYTLKIESYQPEITIPEEQPRSKFKRTATVDYGYGSGPMLYEGEAYIKAFDVIKRVNGSEVSRVFFIDKDNKEYELINVKTNKAAVYGYFPEGMELGDYTIRIENYSKKVTLKKVFKLEKAYGEV